MNRRRKTLFVGIAAVVAVAFLLPSIRPQADGLAESSSAESRSNRGQHSNHAHLTRVGWLARQLTTQEGTSAPSAGSTDSGARIPPPSPEWLRRNALPVWNASQDTPAPTESQPKRAELEHMLSRLPPVCLSEIPGLTMAPSAPVTEHQAYGMRDPVSPPHQHAQTPQHAQGTPGNPTMGNPTHFSSSSGTHSPRNGHQHANPPLPNPHANASAHNLTTNQPADAYPEDPHAEVFSKTAYPSATECAKCHQQIYDEWASSSHAYAAISPMFHIFEQKINELSQGTVGYFCMRCHAPVATTMGMSRDQTIWDGPRVFREGVTCVACHRVKEQYGKTNGERRMEPGDLFSPVYGSGDGMGIEKALKNKDHFKLKTGPHDKGIGQPIHRRGIQFEQLSRSDFCMSCHQVAVHPGIKLEVVWDQYRGSPAYRNGVTCQDCHMGKVPGVDAGYSIGPAAVIEGKVVNPDRKHANHAFYGPGYSIAHPGIFPHNVQADRWSPSQWLTFDWRAGWGTEAFEEKIERGEFQVYFPPEWSNVDDRYDARDVIDANLKKLAYKNELRRQVLENGSKIDGPFFQSSRSAGQDLDFHYVVTNTNPGHNMPSGSLGAQPQIWLNVVLIGPDGRRLWESGYLDSIGDLADLHSADVLADRVPHDSQLFNLQTKFLITNVKGTDREFPLPINVDVDPLPFLRPGAQPISVINHPPLIRMEAHSLPPLGSRRASYRIPGQLLCVPGRYRLSVRLRSRAEPIYFMRFCGSTPEMERAMNEQIMDAHPYTVTFEIR